MADPAFRSSSNAAQQTGSTFSVTKPAGCADGDLLTAYEETVLGGGTAPATPAGWTLKDTQTHSGGFNVLQRFEKLAASEGASYTFNGAGGSPIGNESSVYIVCSTAAGSASEGSSKTSGTGTTADPGSYTTLQNNELLIVAWAIGANVDTITPDASFTALGSIGGGSEKVNVGYKVQAVAGGTANTSATLTSSLAWGAILAAIPPSAGGGSTASVTGGGAAGVGSPPNPFAARTASRRTGSRR